MDVIEAFVLNGTTHDVMILWENHKPLFKAADVGAILGIRHIRSSIEDFSEVHKVVATTHSLGGPQETTFLTKKGVYRLLMRSRKPAAEPFQNWIEDVVESIEETGKYELQIERANMANTIAEQVAIQIEAEAEKYKHQSHRFKHEALTKAYHLKNVVYIGFVVIDEASGRVKIKIGYTNNAASRFDSHKENFGMFYVFHMIEVQNCKDFETYLHNHKMIKPFRDNNFTYVDVASGNVTRHSNEIYYIDLAYVDKIINVADRNAYKFKGLDVEQAEQLLESRRDEIKDDYALATLQFNATLAQKAIIEASSSTVVNIPTSTEIPEILYMPDDRKVTVGRGPKIQIYNPETRQLVHTFACLVEPTRANNHVVSCSKPMIISAIKDGYVYKGFYWKNLARNLPDDTIQELPDADDVNNRRSTNIGYVAMLNLAKNRIERVFADIKTASADRQFTTLAAVSKAVNKGTKSGGHYFVMWDQCEKTLKDVYLTRDNLPPKAQRVNSIGVKQHHPVNNNIIREYSCIEDVIKELKIGREKLKEALKYNFVCKGFKWSL